MKHLLTLCIAITAFAFNSYAQCPNPPNPLMITNTQPCTLCFTITEYDPVCNVCAVYTVCVPPGTFGMPVGPRCGAIETVAVSDTPPPFMPPPCSAVGNAPWACCVPPGAAAVPWNMCACGGAPVMMTWGGGPGAPTITV